MNRLFPLCFCLFLGCEFYESVKFLGNFEVSMQSRFRISGVEWHAKETTT